MTQPEALQNRTIEGSADGPHVLITAGVHGDEFEPMACVRRLLKVIEPDGLRGRLTLVPTVNEGAYRNKHRFDTDGLDLARVFPGFAHVPDTLRTAHLLAGLIHEADYYIDLHTGGTTMMVTPMVGYCLHEDAGIHDKQRDMARAFNLPFVWGTSGKLPGRSLSVARDAGVPALYTEYLGGARCTPEGVQDLFDGCLNVLGLLDMIDREQPADRIDHFVEDERELSGYMQIQNPAPMEGFFEPAVTLGQSIERGDLIGTVCDVMGDRVEPVHAMQTGIVLTLKSFPRVDENEGVAVIVEVDRPLGG